MKKNSLLKLSIAGLISLSCFATTNATVTHASSLLVKSYIYNAQGKRTKQAPLRKGKNVRNYGTKWIKNKKYLKIGKNKYIRFSNVGTRKQKQASIYKVKTEKHPTLNLDQKKVPDAQSLITNFSSLPSGTTAAWNHQPDITNTSDDPTSASITVTFPDKSKKIVYLDFKFYGTNHIKIPEGYTLAAVTEADNTDHASNTLKKATDKGNDINANFTSESEADDKEKVDFNNLTDAQKSTLSNFAVRLINEVRNQVGSSPVSTDSEVQGLADQVAQRYKKDNYSYSQGHDVDGLSDVLSNQSGWAEDMAALSGDDFNHGKPKTMTDMKNLVYTSIYEYLFFGTEWHHAGSIVGDDDLTRVAVSYAYTPDELYVTHFIFI